MLVGCSKMKADLKGDARLPAEQLYTSPLFRLSLAYARTLAPDSNIRILSAQHGAVGLGERLGPYDLALEDLSKREREDWGALVAARLAALVGRGPREVIILAGPLYVEALRSGASVRSLPWMLRDPLEGKGIPQRLHWLKEHAEETPAAESIYQPFLRLLEAAASVDYGGPLPERRRRNLERVNAAMVDHIAREVRAVDFWRSAVAQANLQAWVAKLLDDHDVVLLKSAVQVAEQVVQLARRHHDALIAQASVPPSIQVQIVADVIEVAKKDPQVIAWAAANELENFALVMQDKIRDLLIQRDGQDEAFVARYLDDPDLRARVSQEAAQRIYEELRRRPAPSTALASSEETGVAGPPAVLADAALAVSPAREKGLILRFLRDKARFAPATKTGLKETGLYHQCALTIEQRASSATDTAEEVRGAAVAHLRSWAAKTKGKPGEALFIAAKEIEAGEHLTPETPGENAAATWETMLPSAADVPPASAAPPVARVESSAGPAIEKAFILGFLRDSARVPGALLRGIAAETSSAETPIDLRRRAIAYLRAAAGKAHGKPGDRIEKAAAAIEAGEHLPEPIHVDEAEQADGSAAPGEDFAMVKKRDGGWQRVTLLARDGDLIAHADLVRPGLAVSHVTGAKVHGNFATLEDARAFMFDLNGPELRPVFDRVLVGGKKAGRELGRLIERNAPSRLERYRRAEQAKQSLFKDKLAQSPQMHAIFGNIADSAASPQRERAEMPEPMAGPMPSARSAPVPPLSVLGDAVRAQPAPSSGAPPASKPVPPLSELAEPLRAAPVSSKPASTGALDEQEQALCELLDKPSLSSGDRVRLKAASKRLLEEVQKHIAQIDRWTEKQQTQADVEVFILDRVTDLLPSPQFSDEEKAAAARRVFDHIRQRSMAAARRDQTPPGFHKDGDRLYADTAFLTAAGQLPGYSVRHLGFGEFTIETPFGEIEFNRLAGEDFPGQTGRSHLLEGPPAAIAELRKAMGVDDASLAASAPGTPPVPPTPPPPASAAPRATTTPPERLPAEELLPDDAIELQGEAPRRRANLAAMELAAELARAPRALTDDDRRILAAYSGWGGLSLRAAADKFPAGFPKPEERGLIHEYYTPSRVCREVARVIAPLLPPLANAEGRVEALEPSAGIGRFVRAFEGPSFEMVRWHAVEYSAVSAAMLRAMRPALDLYEGPFEKWVTEHENELAGVLQLVVANPPYGKRGASRVEDTNPEYRLKDAYAYFLRRGLDLLAPGGLGIYVIPSGFLSGTGAENVALREAVLRRHHLSAAYRMPSGLFPGTEVVTDLLFFRAREVVLAEVDGADRSILQGKYYTEYPAHILGKEVGTPGASWRHGGYEIVGEFTSLPELRERPLCGTCGHGTPRIRARVKHEDRALKKQPPDVEFRLRSASSLGRRVGVYLAAVAAQDNEDPSLSWQELHRGLLDWTTAYGAPSLDVELVKWAKEDAGAQRFLSAFIPRSTQLIPALTARPKWEPRYQGRADDLLAKAEFLYRQHRKLSPADLGNPDLSALFAGGWCEDRPGELVPPDVYYTGDLWPKYDRAKARAAQGDRQASEQAKKVLALIKPAVFDEIEGVSPRQGWVPLELVAGWMATLNYGEPVRLVRVDGLVQLAEKKYEDLDAGARTDVVLAIGWINHDKTLFLPRHRKDQDIDEVRLELAKAWNQSFRAWCGADEGRRSAIERAYQRAFQGYREPAYSAEPLSLVRWGKTVRLHPHQNASARRVLMNRGGLIAFDVGVGKTYTGIAVLAGARQEGWAKRPVILVPNSLIWKWEKDILRALPDYRVGIVGAKRKVIASGPRKGHATSDTDTPAERAATWTRFQGGEYDVVLLTYSALPRTRMNEEFVRKYADSTAAIEREVALRRRNAGNKEAGKRKGDLSEREQAILKEGVAAWVAEQMELPGGWAPDPGIVWEDIGCDLLIVDEAQNFKNLHHPEAREGGVPRFMGSAGEGSKRAWQLDFRSASVRDRTGGAGVVLLSATPAKNSPLEFYNLLKQVDAKAFERQGIYDPEQFIDRYCKIEVQEVVDAKMDVVPRASVVGFQNLHELRDTLNRYGEFKTAEDVGIPLPQPEVRRIEVDLSPDQEAKYTRYVAEIERALDDPRSSNEVLGYLARMALVAIHPNLDEGYTWKTAKNVPSPHSPKFDALAAEIKGLSACGHIVFCDNVAAHAWVRMVLIEAGIPAERIAVLNADVAEAPADRQRIAMEFNGSPEEGIEPKYDVVIANAIAYEGVDLQTRTCAIHHLDLPWEPATLEQRNGRGRRQGNKRATIQIVYYFARRSQDGLRFNLIQGKANWLGEILKSQRRDTNNPGAQMKLGPEEILLLISRDPAKTQERLNAVKEKREAEAKRKIAEEASATLRGAARRFELARTTRDPEEASIQRSEAEQRLEDLARVDVTAWPWSKWAYAARDHAMLVPPGPHSPVYEGLRVAPPNVNDAAVIEYTEFGKIRDDKIGVRRVGSPAWKLATMQEVAALKLQPEHRTDTWPTEEDNAALGRRMTEQVLPQLRRGQQGERVWRELNWAGATDAFVDAAWARFGEEIIAALASSGWWAEKLAIPVLAQRVLKVGVVETYDRVVPPTKEGWSEFLRLAPSSKLKFEQLEKAGEFWFGRKIPRNLLSASRSSEKPSSIETAAEVANKSPAEAASEAASARPSVTREAMRDLFEVGGAA